MIKKLPESHLEKVKRTKIRVIGIGGGGSSIVSEIASQVKQASFVVANTDLKALRAASRKASRFQFGERLTRGLGTGMNNELGEAAAQQDKERIKKLLEGQDLCILVASLGGGAGSGATPVFAKISRSLGNLTFGIFTLPFKFEGEKKMEIAKASLEKIKPHLNALSIIPNERIFQLVEKSTPLQQALSVINKNLSDSLIGLIEAIYEPGLINIDFADLKTVLDGRGRLTYLNAVAVPRGEKSAQESIEKVLNSPLYPYTIRGAKGVLFNIVGEKEINLDEVNRISGTISGLLNKEAKIIFGIAQDKKCRDKIKTTLLAVGCSSKIFSEKFKKEKEVKKKPLTKKPLEKKQKIELNPEKKIETASVKKAKPRLKNKREKNVKKKRRKENKKN